MHAQEQGAGAAKAVINTCAALPPAPTLRKISRFCQAKRVLHGSTLSTFLILRSRHANSAQQMLKALHNERAPTVTVARTACAMLTMASTQT